MNSFTSGTLAAISASLCSTVRSSSLAGVGVRHKDTRVSKNTKRNKSTPAKFKFLYRTYDGHGIFLNTKTNRPAFKKISAEGLSRAALNHFGIVLFK